MLHAFARLMAGVVMTLAGIVAGAQDYPARPVKIIVPFAAGGPADIYARFLAQRLSEAMGQPFVVDDRPGAGSVIGTDAVAKSAPDGYTLLMMSNTQTVNESLMPNKPYALMRDFVPIAPVNYSDLVLVVHPSVPADTLAELIALAKAKPGKLNYASSGPGTPYHMAGELFKAMAGVDIVHVPYKGSSRRAHRRARRAGADDVRRRDHDERAREGRQGQGARHHRQGALVGAAQRADDLRGRRAGLRGGDLARPHGAEGHAAGRSSTASTPRSRRSPARPEVRAEWAKQGAVADDDDAGGIRALHRRRHRQVGAHRQDLRREAGPVSVTIELAVISAGAAKGSA